jgi:hypothetical protein
MDTNRFSLPLLEGKRAAGVWIYSKHRATRNTSCLSLLLLLFGAHGERETPVPIPNTVVKPLSGYNTWGSPLGK